MFQLSARRTPGCEYGSGLTKPCMKRTLGLAIVAAAVLALAEACSPGPAGSGSTTATTTASPSPSIDHALTASFMSPTMGYSVSYPAGWVITTASRTWALRHTSFWDTPDGDRLEGQGAGFRGTSQALAPGESAATWIADYVRSSLPCGTQEQVPVGNHLGTVDLNDCPGQGRLRGRVFDIAVVVDGRGYDFTMEGAVDRTFWLAMLATVTFSAQSANDSAPAA